MQKIKLIDLFNNDFSYVINGYSLFNYLAERDANDDALYPLIEQFINDDNAGTLDVDYFFGYSADKKLSSLMKRVVEVNLSAMGYTWEDLINKNVFANGDGDTLLEETFKQSPLISVIYNRFGEKWKRIYDAMMSSYNPIDNYNMIEKRTPNTKRTETFNDVTDERTPNLVTSGSANAKTGVYGFNGTDAKDSASNDGTSSESVTGTDTNVKSGSIEVAETGSEELTRRGNIGVTTSQQMIESELQLRKHDFYRIIFNDIDSVLCSMIY